MDPEVVKELTDSINQLNNLIANQSTLLGGLSKSMNDSANSTQQNSSAQTKNTGALNKNTGATNKLKEAEDEAAKAVAELGSNLSTGLSQAKTSLDSFTKAVLSNEEGFSKYGVATSGLGKAVFSVVKSFGSSGFVLGGLTVAFGAVLEASFKQTDALLKGVDTLSGIGAAGDITTNEMLDMAHKMGLNARNLEVFTKAAASASESMVALGNTSGDGIKEFGSLTSYTTKQLNTFQRLGVSQEELIQQSADYLNMQVKAGIGIDKSNLANGKVQEEMEKYSEDLLVIEKLTGMNAKSAKEALDAANASSNMAIHNAEQQQKLDSIKDKNSEEYINLKKQQLVDQQLVKAAALTGNKEYLTAMQAYIATGTFSGPAKLLLNMGYSQDSLNKIRNDAYKKNLTDLTKEGEVGTATAGLLTSYAGNVQRVTKNLGTAMTFNDKVANTFLGDSAQAIVGASRLSGKDIQKLIDDERKRIEAEKQGKGAAAEDPAQKSRNDLTNTERFLNIKYDELIAWMNPLLGHTGALEALGIAAAGVAAVMTFSMLKKGGSGAVKGIMSLFGGKSKSAGASAATNLSKVAGGGIIGAAEEAGGAAESTALNNLNKVAGQGGGMVGGFLNSIVEGLIAAGGGAPEIALGGAAIGAAIAAIGAGLAAATAIIGVALPTLATGLQKFDKVNGPNLAAVGLGMAGLGAGVAVLGAGKVLGAIGDIAKFFTGSGNDDPIKNVSDQVDRLGRYNFNTVKIKNNADALVAFSTAIAAANVLSGISSLGKIGGALADAASGLLKSPPPFAKFVEFSNLNIDEKKTETNTKAFVNFANAMSTYRGGPGLLDAVSSLAGAGLNTIFGKTGPIEAFIRFAKMDFGPKAGSNADAFLKYAQAMGLVANNAKGSAGGSEPAAAAAQNQTAPAPPAEPSTGASGGGGSSAAPADSTEGKVIVGDLVGPSSSSSSKMMKAATGGIFDSGNASFPSSNPGKKLAPLNSSSIISRLAKTNISETSSAAKSAPNNIMSETADNSNQDNTLELYHMIQSKLGRVLAALEHSHSTQNKILQHTMV